MSEERKRILTMLSEGKITAEEADKLLEALGGEHAEKDTDTCSEGNRQKPRYFRVQVSTEEGGQLVNIRIPVAILKAGVKLGSLMPEESRKKVRDALKEKGVDVDFSKADRQTIENVLEQLRETSIDIDEDGKRVRVFCE